MYWSGFDVYLCFPWWRHETKTLSALLTLCEGNSQGGSFHKRPVMRNIDVSAIQYIPRNMHTVFALLCFVVAIHWLIFPYPSGLLHWHCGNLTIAPVPAKQPWWISINTSCEFIMNDCITTTKQSTTKPCAYFLGYTVTNCWTSTSVFGDLRRHDSHVISMKCIC